MQGGKRPTKAPKCKVCGSEYQKFSTTQQACSPPCALELVRARKGREFDRETKRLKEKIKSRSDWLKEAQAVFNKYVRIRDENEPCISCGRHHTGQYHAGHFLSVGSSPELRFHPFNNNKQCSPCNNHLSGNIVRYRPNLISKIGLVAVEWLEGPHEAQHLTIDDIKEIKAYYKEQIKLLTDKR